MFNYLLMNISFRHSDFVFHLQNDTSLLEISKHRTAIDEVLKTARIIIICVVENAFVV